MNFRIKGKEKLWMLNFMTGNCDYFKIYFMFLQKFEQIYLSMKGKLTSKSFLFLYFFHWLECPPRGFLIEVFTLLSDGLNSLCYFCTVR